MSAIKACLTVVTALVVLAFTQSAPASPGISGADVNTHINIQTPCNDKSKQKNNPRLKQFCSRSKANKRINKIEADAEKKISDYVGKQVEQGNGPLYNYLYAILEPIVGSYVAYATDMAYSIAYSYLPG